MSDSVYTNASSSGPESELGIDMVDAVSSLSMSLATRMSAGSIYGSALVNVIPLSTVTQSSTCSSAVAIIVFEGVKGIFGLEGVFGSKMSLV